MRYPMLGRRLANVRSLSGLVRRLLDPSPRPRRLDGPLHALRSSVKVFQWEELVSKTPVRKAHAPRLASCPPLAGGSPVMSMTPAGGGQLASVKRRKATDQGIQLRNRADWNGLPWKPEVPEEWRTALPQGVEIDALVVSRSGLPAAVEDPYPLERQCPDGGLIRTALCSLLPVVGARPERFVDGLARPFDEGLAQEFRALPAPVHPALLAAALGDRRDAGVLLQFISALEALTLLAECSQQARRQMRTCSGQAVKQVEVGQRACD